MRKVILIDADSLLYKDIEDIEVYQDRIDEIFSEAIQKSKADYYKVFIESPNNYTFRKILNKKYKSNRANKELPHNYHEIKQYIIETYNPAVASGIESDDYLISTWSYLKKKHPLTDVVVCANDKDYKTHPINYMDLYYGRYLETSTITEKEALKNFAIQMLMGDSGDGVSCLKGIGKKHSEKIIAKCKTKNQYIRAIWREYLNHYKSPNRARKEIVNNYLMLKIRDDVKYVYDFEKVFFE